MNKPPDRDTGFICTSYFKGKDGLGTCNTGCQWWSEKGCPCAKGSDSWDGLEHYTERFEEKKVNSLDEN